MAEKNPARKKPERRVPAMISPLADALCVGGASILVSLVVLALGIRLPMKYTAAMLAVNFLINAPHFLVSYRMVYGSSRRRHEHRGVALYMPLTLLVYMIVSLVAFPYAPLLLTAMAGAAAVLLAWHYTGQAWGRMASSRDGW